VLNTAWAGDKDVLQMNLAELVNVEVSSVSRKEQPLSQTAAAVYVITQEDIRRSGASSIPDLLRMVPGVQVAQIDGSKWAISARGFNGRFANKMLVLIDGRSVYTNLYSGVYWDQNDCLLEDIERIEVIRGPGATMWGANAVNGVINIITRSAKSTLGTLVTLGSGTEEPAAVAVRYGGKAGSKFFYRAYTKYFQISDSATQTGADAGDSWNSVRAGGRLDWSLSEQDSLTAHGDFYSGRSRQTIFTNFPLMALGQLESDRVSFSGGYGLVRWEHHGSERSGLALQAYVNQENRLEGAGNGQFRTVDFDFQHRTPIAHRHDFSWGLGFRLMTDTIDTSMFASFVPPSRTDSLYSSFLQDDLTLVENRLVVTAGSKFQRNAYTGFEVQPSVRLSWTPTSQQSVWAAVSRAVRTPARKDADLRLSFQVPMPTGQMATGELMGNRELLAETEIAYELGIRHQFGNHVAIDVAGFLNRYGKLQGWKVGDPSLEFVPQPVVIIPITSANVSSATTHGVETAVTWNVLPSWKLTGSHSWLSMRYSDGTPTQFGIGVDPTGPTHQFQVRSNLSLSSKLTLDAAAYYVSALTHQAIPAYLRCDLRLGAKLAHNVELSVGGRNLLDDRHPEFRSEDYIRSAEARRSAYLKISFEF
jgi:iron complex outermembrane receptor protein